MKVENLQAGQLYMVDDHDLVVVVVARGNHVDIVKARASVRWDKDKESIKGRPALYCGSVRRNDKYFRQGWFKTHKFLINGECYFIHGSSIKNIYPLI